MCLNFTGDFVSGCINGKQCAQNIKKTWMSKTTKMRLNFTANVLFPDASNVKMCPEHIYKLRKSKNSKTCLIFTENRFVCGRIDR